MDRRGHDLLARHFLLHELRQLLGVVVVVLGQVKLLGRRGFDQGFRELEFLGAHGGSRHHVLERHRLRDLVLVIKNDGVQQAVHRPNKHEQVPAVHHHLGDRDLLHLDHALHQQRVRLHAGRPVRKQVVAAA